MYDIGHVIFANIRKKIYIFTNSVGPTHYDS